MPVAPLPVLRLVAEVVVDVHDGMVSVRRVGYFTTIMAGLVVAGLGAYFTYIDDDRATVQATILGALAQVAGLAVAVYACWLTVKTSSTPAPSVHVQQRISGSRIDRSTVIGNIGAYQAGHDGRAPR
jgi:hypothetical protein